MKIISSFEKVLTAVKEERKKYRFDNGVEPKIEDQDGAIISFENGHVFFCDGEWYERQYSNKRDIFTSPINVEAILLELEVNSGFSKEKIEEVKLAFNKWLHCGNASECPISYDLIVSSSIQAEWEKKIEPDSVNLQVELLGPTEAYIGEECGSGISLTATSKEDLAEQIKNCMLDYLNNEE